jgi:hypothetical protein
MISYKIVNDRDGNVSSVLRSDGWSIPLAPDNTDYQEFLRYKEAGGKVYEADEEVPVNG